MHFARLQSEKGPIIAVQHQNGLYNISKIRDISNANILTFLSAPNTHLGTLDADLTAAQAQGIILPLVPSCTNSLTPVERPGKISLGLNYVAHAKEGGFTPPDYPTIFMRCTTSLTPHNRNIKLPACSDKLDFEGEMAVIIGQKAYNVREDNARDYVAGYSIFNDGTLRDYQKRTSQWVIGKNFDSTGGFIHGIRHVFLNATLINFSFL